MTILNISFSISLQGNNNDLASSSMADERFLDARVGVSRDFANVLAFIRHNRCVVDMYMKRSK